MKRNLILTAVASLIAVMTTSCGGWGEPYYPYSDSHVIMDVNNSSQHRIAWMVPEHGAVECAQSGALPDTLSAYLKEYIYTLEPGSSMRFVVYDGAQASPLEQYHPKDTVSFYFFDAEVLSSTPWKQIVAQRRWLAHYRLTVDDLLNNHQVISYPSSVYPSFD